MPLELKQIDNDTLEVVKCHDEEDQQGDNECSESPYYKEIRVTVHVELHLFHQMIRYSKFYFDVLIGPEEPHCDIAAINITNFINLPDFDYVVAIEAGS